MAEQRPSGPESLVRGYGGRISLLLAAGLLVLKIGQQGLPPLLPTIIDDLAITTTQAGTALTTLWAAFALVQYPGGRLSDGLSRRTVLVVALALAIVGFGILTVVAAYPVLLVAAAFAGAGVGAFVVASRAALSDLFVQKRGRAFGMNQAAGTMGAALAAAVAVGALALGVWQAAFVPVLVLAAGIALLLSRWSREPFVVRRVDLALRPTFARVFGTARIRWLVLSYSMVIFAWNGVLGFLPTFLQAEKGLDPALASGAFAVPFLIGIVVMPAAGGLSDRLSRLPVTVGAAVVSGVGLGLLVVADSGLGLAGAIVLFGVGLMAYPPVMQAHLMDAFPSGNMGGDFGAFRTVYQLLASTGPAYVGFVAERASYALAFGGIAVSLVVSAAIVLYVQRVRR